MDAWLAVDVVTKYTRDNNLHRIPSMYNSMALNVLEYSAFCSHLRWKTFHHISAQDIQHNDVSYDGGRRVGSNMSGFQTIEYI